MALAQNFRYPLVLLTLTLSTLLVCQQAGAVPIAYTVFLEGGTDLGLERKGDPDPGTYVTFNDDFADLETVAETNVPGATDVFVSENAESCGAHCSEITILLSNPGSTLFSGNLISDQAVFALNGLNNNGILPANFTTLGSTVEMAVGLLGGTSVSFSPIDVSVGGVTNVLGLYVQFDASYLVEATSIQLSYVETQDVSSPATAILLIAGVVGLFASRRSMGNLVRR
jgi:hypothetical protein